MKKYEALEMEIQLINVDVITTSGVGSEAEKLNEFDDVIFDFGNN